MDIAGIVLVALVAHRPETFLGDDFGEPQNGIQGRPQFVTHIGKKGRLGGVGGFRLEPFLQRLVARLLQLARQILDLEAQQRVLLRLNYKRLADQPQMDPEERRRNGYGIVKVRTSKRKARGDHQAYRCEGADKPRHVAAPRQQ